MKSKILLVEDEAGEELTEMLLDEGYEVKLCENSDDFFKCYESFIPDLVIIDIILKGSKLNGIEVLEKIKENIFVSPEVIIISGEATRNDVAEAMKLGVYTFIEKTGYFDQDKFLIDVNNAVKLKKQRTYINSLENDIKGLSKSKNNLINIIGRSQKIEEVKRKIEKFSKIDKDILIIGETGTGKEVVANNLHFLSDRDERKFIRVNCGAITKSLIEPEIFGSTKGSFTGAVENKNGYLGETKGGTLFLDELQLLTIEQQTRLLRALENKEFIPVGSSEAKKFKGTLIFGMNEQPIDMKIDGRMKNDFFHRLDSALTIELPPLREREDDIVLFMDYFIKHENHKNKMNLILNYDLNKIFDKIISHKWEGNVREVRNFCTKIVLTTNEKVITNNVILKELRKTFERNSPNTNHGYENFYDIPEYHEAIEEFEKEYFRYRLEINDWNKNQTSKELNYDRAALHKKLKKYNIV